MLTSADGRNRLVLLAILLLAFGLRVYALDKQSLWYDEAVTAQVAGKGVAELTRWTADDIQPPLYYYVVAGWTRLVRAGTTGMTAGGEWALRFPSAAAGTLLVAAIWVAARRLLRRSGTAARIAANVAALLAAISPLYIYYSQEARMYTLLALLAVLSGYALIRAAGAAGRSAVAWWVAFVLLSAALLYTHYFAVFLIAAYAACFFAACLGRNRTGQRRWRRFAYGILAFAAIGLLYLPWVPSLLARYRLDRSYWLGSLKLGEALRHVAINFAAAAPETMLEADALRWLPWFGLVFVLVVAAAFIAARSKRGFLWPTVILLVVLVLPIVAVLALAAANPKFNPRYLMMVSPAYLLLLAGGIAALWSSGRTAARLTAGLLLVFLVIASTVGIRSWFADPAFTKAQWRELAAHVRSARTADEEVLLVSGHAYPAWDYYAADMPAARLPAIDILDVDAVLSFESGNLLERALSGKAGAWLVEWQDEVVDPVGFVPFLLDRAGEERAAGRELWHLGLRHWALYPDATFPTEPQPQHADTANFDHKLALLGWDGPQKGKAGREITAYWRVINSLTRDYRVSLTLEDTAGNEVGRWDGRPAGYDYPTTRWQVGQSYFGRYPLPLPEDISPGEYYMTMAVYDPENPSGLDIRDVADNPAGKRVRIGPIVVG